MVTICSRFVNEIFRSHLIQFAATYHGGMEAIAFEWGTNSRVSGNLRVSHDDKAMQAFSAIGSAYAGKYTGKYFRYGNMVDLVYAVHGGMEDWGFGGSWDPKSKHAVCKPTTFGGYPEAKTKYTDAMLR